eukprot:10285010-Prorocentrum_lima.AAC.1
MGPAIAGSSSTRARAARRRASVCTSGSSAPTVGTSPRPICEACKAALLAPAAARYPGEGATGALPP